MTTIIVLARQYRQEKRALERQRDCDTTPEMQDGTADPEPARHAQEAPRDRGEPATP